VRDGTLDCCFAHHLSAASLYATPSTETQSPLSFAAIQNTFLKSREVGVIVPTVIASGDLFEHRAEEGSGVWVWG
jgi:hypothetical protein